MKIKALFVYTQSTGETFAEAYGEIDQLAWVKKQDRNDTVSAHYSILTSNGGKLPGLSSAFTDLRCVLTAENGSELVFNSGELLYEI